MKLGHVHKKKAKGLKPIALRQNPKTEDGSAGNVLIQALHSTVPGARALRLHAREHSRAKTSIIPNHVLGRRHQFVGIIQDRFHDILRRCLQNH